MTIPCHLSRGLCHESTKNLDGRRGKEYIRLYALAGTKLGSGGPNSTNALLLVVVNCPSQPRLGAEGRSLLGEVERREVIGRGGRVSTILCESPKLPSSQVCITPSKFSPGPMGM